MASIAAYAQTPLPTYEKSSETKVKGVVVAITVPDGTHVHLVVFSSPKTIDVLLGPEKFLKLLGIIFHKGDHVEITGSQVTFHGAPLLVAREISRESEVVTLRDGEGTPVWEGWAP